jgi:adenylylsulfate kinase-like enzyme
MYRKAFDAIEFSVSGSKELTEEFEKKVAVLLARATIVDAIYQELSFIKARRNNVVNRLASLFRSINRPGKIVPTTYATAYDVASRLLVKGSSEYELSCIGVPLGLPMENPMKYRLVR